MTDELDIEAAGADEGGFGSFFVLAPRFAD